jgi:hypothetical protein
MKALWLQNNMWEHIFKPIGQNFGNQLIKTVQRLIGLNSETVIGCLDFGISTIFVKLTDSSILAQLKNFKIATHTSFPTISQFFWKNSIVNRQGLTPSLDPSDLKQSSLLNLKILPIAYYS